MEVCPETVRVDVGEPRLCGVAVEDIAGTLGSHRAALAEHQPGRPGARLHSLHAQVAVDSLGGLAYTRGNEGRGIGLGHELRAHE